jgi:hypothetical protein
LFEIFLIYPLPDIRIARSVARQITLPVTNICVNNGIQRQHLPATFAPHLFLQRYRFQ